MCALFNKAQEEMKGYIISHFSPEITSLQKNSDLEFHAPL